MSAKRRAHRRSASIEAAHDAVYHRTERDGDQATLERLEAEQERALEGVGERARAAMAKLGDKPS
jgi:hypothetical protein